MRITITDSDLKEERFRSDTAKICCSQTEILLPLKIKFAFLKFPPKINELIDFKAKKCSPTKNYRLMDHFEYSWAHFFIVFLCTSKFLSFYGQTRFFDYWLFCYANQSINKRFSILPILLFSARSRFSRCLIQRLFQQPEVNETGH